MTVSGQAGERAVAGEGGEAEGAGEAGQGEGWLLIRLATRTLWLPERDAHELAVGVTTTRVVDRPGSAWEPGAVAPAGRWWAIRGLGPPRPVTDPVFHVDRDVALVKLGNPDGQESAPHDQIARLGVVDRHLGVIEQARRAGAPGAAGEEVPAEDRPDAQDRVRGRLLGLHLDNWDRLPAGHRHASRNRASLNLGPDARWFLFVDLDVVGVHSDDVVPDTVAARRLVQRAPDAPPVVRVRVPAGWAYVAPTENVLHEACWLGRCQGTSHASALGRFTPTHGVPRVSATAIDADLRGGRTAASPSAVPEP